MVQTYTIDIITKEMDFIKFQNAKQFSTTKHTLNFKCQDSLISIERSNVFSFIRTPESTHDAQITPKGYASEPAKEPKCELTEKDHKVYNQIMNIHALSNAHTTNLNFMKAVTQILDMSITASDYINFANKYTTIENDVWSLETFTTNYAQSIQKLTDIAKNVGHLFDQLDVETATTPPSLKFSDLPQHIKDEYTQHGAYAAPDDSEVKVFTSNYDFEKWYFDGPGPKISQFVIADITLEQQSVSIPIPKPMGQMRVIELFYPTEDILFISHDRDYFIYNLDE